MPIYESQLPHEEMQKLIDKGCVCLECGSIFTIAWGGFYGHNEYMLRCGQDPTHNGIARDASLSPYDIPGFNLFNLNKGRRKMTEEQVGKEVGTKLAKYMGVVSLTKPQAKEILVAVFPEAPASEITRAMILCASYGLNPLMKHVFLIPFNKGKANETWATVIGIKAKRLLASRRGNYSYVDNTPRVMSEEEQRRIFGEVSRDKLMVITKVKDPATGAESPGYGSWPKDSEPYGTEKGNSKFNMAAIRSESQALDRLRPGEMPVGVEVVPEELAEGVVEGEYTVKEEPPPEPVSQEANPKEHWCKEHNCAFELKKSRFGSFYAHKIKGGGWCNEKKQAEASKDEPEHPPDEAGKEVEDVIAEAQATASLIDMDWLNESLKTLEATKLKAWSEANLLSYIKTTYKVEGKTVLEAVAQLDKGQAAHFVKRVQETLDMA